MAKGTCSVEGCSGEAKGRGLCWKHYKRLQRAGGVVPTTLTERLWRGIRKNPSGCWEWTGTISCTGYGRIVIGTTAFTVHRVLYELVVEPVPGLELDHLCRNRACCNPTHLEPVTPYENWRRGNSPTAVNARKEVCNNGHPFDRVLKDGSRRCGTCANERTRRWREKKGTPAHG